LQHETGITNVVDPLAGSYYVESLTHELAEKAWALMLEVEAMGGMEKAVATGWPKQQIDEAAIRRKSASDKREDVIVGVNMFELEQEDDHASREVDNASVRKSQTEKLRRIKSSRDPQAVQDTLASLEAVAKSEQENILDAAITAARARATIGEISDVLRNVFGEHAAVPHFVRNVHGETYAGDAEYEVLRQRLKTLAATPRLLVAKLGQDGHDRGAKVISSAFSDAGFDVVSGPLFQTPVEAAALAVAENVQIVGVSSLTAGHKVLLPELVASLKTKGRTDILVVCGGVIPRRDYAFLKQHGVAEIFGPGTNLIDAMRTVLDLLEGKRRNA
jgi:methylmalonyl-CoA mutase